MSKKRMDFFNEMKERMPIRNEIWKAKEEMNRQMNILSANLFEEGIKEFREWFEKINERLKNELNVGKFSDCGDLKEYFIKEDGWSDIKISIHLHVSEFHFVEKCPERVMSVKIRGIANEGRIFDIGLNYLDDEVDDVILEIRTACEIGNKDVFDFPIKWFK